jgi:hypothetical protein
MASAGHNASPSNWTQVPQLLLRLRGTGMIFAGHCLLSHIFLKRIAPKWE